MLMTPLAKRFTPYLFFSALLLIIAIFLRFHDLGERSLWYDEIAAANNSNAALSQVISNTRHNNSSPILYPVLLNIVESFDLSPTALRLPSAIASVLAVLVILALPRIGIDNIVAFLAALLLTFSASQIRYAQEVREYSLSVLVSSVMLYSCISYIKNKNRRYLFLISIFLAPLVQYGLVLFAAALLLFVGYQKQYSYGWRKALSYLMLPTLFLFVGSAFSAWLTLRYQWQLTSAWYLSSSYYEAGYGNIKALANFVTMNTYRFFEFVMPSLTLGLAIPSITLLVYTCYRKIDCDRQFMRIALIALIAVFTVLMTAIAHVYPFGGIRQNLFLAPIVSLLFSTSFVSLSKWFRAEARGAWFVICVIFIVLAGAVDIKKNKPYAEIQDIKSVIDVLEDDMRPDDAVYVYGPARTAMNFYNVEGGNFLYGKYHRNNPDEYLEEIDELVQPDFQRLWLVFSNTYKDEEQFIIAHLAADWSLTKVVDVKGAALYLGVRRHRVD